MKLSPEQQKAVSSWIGAGASIADVQKRLREEFQVSLTYMDTRFLIDDLGLTLKGAAAAEKKNQPRADARVTPGPNAPGAAPGAAVEAEAELLDEGETGDAGLDFAEEPAGVPAAGAGSVKVEVDRLTRPGTVVSGTVTFSDGKSGKWALDQYGRLVFEGSSPGQRPSQADLQAFQRELSAQLQRHGF